MVTVSPRVCSSAPSDAAARPLPSDDSTPPVTKMYLVFMAFHLYLGMLGSSTKQS